MSTLLVLESQCLDGLAQSHLVADGVGERRIALAYLLNHLVAVHLLGHLALLRLTETSHKHLAKVLLLHKLLIELLYTSHLIVREPIRSFQLTQFVNYLGV